MQHHSNITNRHPELVEALPLVSWQSQAAKPSGNKGSMVQRLQRPPSISMLSLKYFLNNEK